jgi:hypothetical protein
MLDEKKKRRRPYGKKVEPEKKKTRNGNHQKRESNYITARRVYGEDEHNLDLQFGIGIWMRLVVGLGVGISHGVG